MLTIIKWLHQIILIDLVVEKTIRKKYVADTEVNSCI
jgi:hypothetical protein